MEGNEINVSLEAIFICIQKVDGFKKFCRAAKVNNSNSLNFSFSIKHYLLPCNLQNSNGCFDQLCNNIHI